MPQLSTSAIRRVSAATRDFEGRPLNTIGDDRKRPRDEGARYAVVTTAITAAVRGTKKLGKGLGKLQRLTEDPSTGDVAYSDIDHDPVKILSGDLAGIAVGRLIQVKRISGFWNVDVDYCGG